MAKFKQLEKTSVILVSQVDFRLKIVLESLKPEEEVTCHTAYCWDPPTQNSVQNCPQVPWNINLIISLAQRIKLHPKKSNKGLKGYFWENMIRFKKKYAKKRGVG